MGIPGLVMLARFAPPGVREPEFTTEEKRAFRPPLGAAALTVRGIAGGFVLGATGLLIVALLAALKTLRETKGAHIDLAWSARSGDPARRHRWVAADRGHPGVRRSSAACLSPLSRPPDAAAAALVAADHAGH